VPAKTIGRELSSTGLRALLKDALCGRPSGTWCQRW